MAAICMLPATPLRGDHGVLPSLDPAKGISQYVLESWHEEDGLPSNQVSDILQTRDNYLWLATSAGLARFDGVRFTEFNLVNTLAMTSEVITVLAEGTDGSLWIGTAGGGLLRLREGRFTALAAGTDPASRDVRALAVDRSGTLWVGSLGGLHRIADGELRAAADPVLAGLPVRALAADEDGALWIGTAGAGVFRYRDGRAAAVPLPATLARSVVLALHRGPAAELWIATEGQGLGRFQDGTHGEDRWEKHGSATVYGIADGLPDDLVTALFEDRAGQLWIGTNDGLVRYRRGGFEAFTEADGLVDGRVRAFFEDREGHLWIGNYAGGLERLKDGFITAFTQAEGLSAHHTRSVYEDRRGRLWIGTVSGGLNCLEDGRITAYTPADGFPSAGAVWSIAETHDDTLWIGTDDGLVRSPEGRFGKGDFTVYTTADGLSHDQVRVVVEDAYEPGALWLGTIGGGVNRLREGAFDHWGTADGLADGDVRWMLPAGPEDVWIGTFLGLHRLHDGVLTHYTTADGLSGNMLAGAYADAAGALWMGTLGSGLTRLADGEITAFTTRDGLLSNDVWWILEDEFEDLWLSNDHGLYRMHRPDLEAYGAGQSLELAAESYGLADGMKTVECNGGGFPAGWKRADGTLWFPTMAGVVRVDPVARRRRILPPPAVIEALRVDGTPVPLEGNPELPPDAVNLELHYTALAFRDPGQVRFRYRLEGYDRDWIDVGARRVAYYPRLPPGRFTFRAVAEYAGVTSEEAATLSFSRRPHLYEERWFGVASVLLLGFLVYGGFRLRTRGIRQRNVRLRAEIRRRRSAETQLSHAVTDLENRNVALKARTAELERFALALSHDLKNPLVTIKVFLGRIRHNVAAGRSAELDGDLRRIDAAADTMRRLLDAKLEYTRLESDFDPADRVALAEVAREIAANCNPAAHGVSLKIADELPTVAGDRRQLGRLLRELVDNAALFTGGQPAPRIEIGARSEGGETVFYVRDNGAGIEARYLEKVFDLFERLEATEERNGVGLAIARRIAELHGGRMWIESAGCGQGTTVCFTLTSGYGSREPAVQSSARAGT